jgi:hypothetical protein
MAWIYLFLLAVVIWGACGGVIYAGRRLWSNDTTLRVHLTAAPIIAFLCAALHAAVAPGFDPLMRAMAMTLSIVALGALVVAPLFERSYAMFQSVIGTWLPFVMIFAAAWAAGVLARR